MKTPQTLLAAALLAASLPAAALTPLPQPFKIDDLVRLERLSDPKIAPDGKHVLYALRQTDYEANKGKKSLWLLSLDKGTNQPEALLADASDGRWNGDFVYFLSNRSGSSQVWRVATKQGSKPTQVTNLPLDVNAFVVQGDKLAVTMDVFLDCPDLACSQKRLAEQDKAPTAGTLYKQLFVRHWDTWKNGTRGQWFVGGIQESQFTNFKQIKIDGDAPTKPFGGAEEAAFSPDGSTFYFSARVAGRIEATSTNVDVWQVPSSGGTPQNLTENNTGTDTAPTPSPDGKSLAWRSMRRAGFEADRLRIMVKDLNTGSVREVAPNWDRSAESLIWSEDGKTLYTHADDVGQNRVFSIDVGTGAAESLTPDGWVEGFDVHQGKLVYAHNTLGKPTDLHLRPDCAGGESYVQLTHLNTNLRGKALAGFEQFSFKGWNNETVHGYVMKPVGFVEGKKYPFTFIVHGGPQGSMGNHWHYRWNPQVFSGMGYGVVFIDFHGSSGYGQAFTDSISGDWGGKPLEDLQKGFDHAIKTYGWLDETKAAALGASYGGYMMNWIAGNWPTRFKALVNHSGVFDGRMMSYATEELWFDEWEHGGTYYEKPEAFEKHNPANFVTKWQTPMLVIHGDKDFRIGIEQGIATFTALQRRNVPSQFLRFPSENHWILKPQNSVQWYNTVQAWLDQWLK
jgi:dipeptidyl aminopeptidase/acylaminoacyl peptidase